MLLQDILEKIKEVKMKKLTHVTSHNDFNFSELCQYETWKDRTMKKVRKTGWYPYYFHLKNGGPYKLGIFNEDDGFWLKDQNDEIIMEFNRHGHFVSAPWDENAILRGVPFLHNAALFRYTGNPSGKVLRKVSIVIQYKNSKGESKFVKNPKL